MTEDDFAPAPINEDMSLEQLYDEYMHSSAAVRIMHGDVSTQVDTVKSDLEYARQDSIVSVVDSHVRGAGTASYHTMPVDLLTHLWNVKTDHFLDAERKLLEAQKELRYVVEQRNAMSGARFASCCADVCID